MSQLVSLQIMHQFQCCELHGYEVTDDEALITNVCYLVLSE